MGGVCSCAKPCENNSKEKWTRLAQQILGYDQCEQIVQFFKVLGKKFLQK